MIRYCAVLFFCLLYFNKAEALSCSQYGVTSTDDVYNYINGINGDRTIKPISCAHGLSSSYCYSANITFLGEEKHLSIGFCAASSFSDADLLKLAISSEIGKNKVIEVHNFTFCNKDLCNEAPNQCFAYGVNLDTDGLPKEIEDNEPYRVACNKNECSSGFIEIEIEDSNTFVQYVGFCKNEVGKDLCEDSLKNVPPPQWAKSIKDVECYSTCGGNLCNSKPTGLSCYESGVTFGADGKINGLDNTIYLDQTLVSCRKEQTSCISGIVKDAPPAHFVQFCGGPLTNASNALETIGLVLKDESFKNCVGAKCNYIKPTCYDYGVSYAANGGLKKIISNLNIKNQEGNIKCAEELDTCWSALVKVEVNPNKVEIGFCGPSTLNETYLKTLKDESDHRVTAVEKLLNCRTPLCNDAQYQCFQYGVEADANGVPLKFNKFSSVDRVHCPTPSFSDSPSCVSGVVSGVDYDQQPFVFNIGYCNDNSLFEDVVEKLAKAGNDRGEYTINKNETHGQSCSSKLCNSPK